MTEIDPFNIPMVFFRIGWMNHYRGVTADDTITGGGAYVAEHGFGDEMFNYLPFEGRFYGWVMVGRSGKTGKQYTVNLSRIARNGTAGLSLSGVIVVWVAKNPAGGMYVVGWYQNATVFRSPQESPPDPNRKHHGVMIEYVATTEVADAVLLPPDERVIQVPKGGKGSFGQSNMWYADDTSNPSHRAIRLEVLDAIQDSALPPAQRPPHHTLPIQHDVLIRQKVEQIAVETVTQHYRRLRYDVRSVEKDNVGWDLLAKLDKRELRLEVKGLSGSHISVEVTPNEYSKMNEFRDSYRLCVVTNSLSAPLLTIFQYSVESNCWATADGYRLSIRELTSARCTVN